MTGSSKRIDTQMVIWFQKASDPETKAVASNLSETGLFIATDQPAKVGDRLSLRLALSRDSGPLEMQGEIKVDPSPRSARRRGAARWLGYRVYRWARAWDYSRESSTAHQRDSGTDCRDVGRWPSQQSSAAEYR